MRSIPGDPEFIKVEGPKVFRSSEESGEVLRPLPRNIFVPTSAIPSISKDETKGLVIDLHLSGSKVPRHLLWHLLFKHIRVIDWFLLHEFLELNLRRGSELWSASLFGLLLESITTRMGVKDFKFQLRPIHKRFRSLTRIVKIEGKDVEVSLLDLIMGKLGIPEKALPIEQLLTVDDRTYQYPVPNPLSFRGVGYKDKGSMGEREIPAPFRENEILSLRSFSTKTLESNWDEIVEYFRPL